MGNSAPSGARVDKKIEAEPILIGGRRIQPVARLVGWEMDGNEAAGPFVSRVGRLTPLAVKIDSAENYGEEPVVISIEDPLQEPIRGILTVCALVSGICIAVMLAARVVAGRK